MIIWSESLDDLDLSSSKKLVKLDLHTPGLPFPKVGRILPKPPLRAPKHKPIVEILKEVSWECIVCDSATLSCYSMTDL